MKTEIALQRGSKLVFTKESIVDDRAGTDYSTLTIIIYKYIF